MYLHAARNTTSAQRAARPSQGLHRRPPHAATLQAALPGHPARCNNTREVSHKRWPCSQGRLWRFVATSSQDLEDSTCVMLKQATPRAKLEMSSAGRSPLLTEWLFAQLIAHGRAGVRASNNYILPRPQSWRSILFWRNWIGQQSSWLLMQTTWHRFNSVWKHNILCMKTHSTFHSGPNSSTGKLSRC